jgi:hypothetical protein
MLIDGLGGGFELSGWMDGGVWCGGHPPLIEMHACVKRGLWSQEWPVGTHVTYAGTLPSDRFLRQTDSIKGVK